MLLAENNITRHEAKRYIRRVAADMGCFIFVVVNDSDPEDDRWLFKHISRVGVAIWYPTLDSAYTDAASGYLQSFNWDTFVFEGDKHE